MGHSFSKAVRDFACNTICIDEAGLLNQLEFLAALGARAIDITSPGNFLNPNLPTQVHLIGDPYQMEPRYSNIQVCEDKCSFDIGEIISPLGYLIRNGERAMTTVLSNCRRGHRAIFQPIFDRF